MQTENWKAIAIAVVSWLLTAGVSRAQEPTDAAEAAIEELPITAADREHWSFKPLARPGLPAVQDASWAITPIDRFILASLEDNGLAPAPSADRLTLLRRLTFDLTGLPPTPAEIEEFLADASDQAYERQVDRLLASPRSGEHFAQAWLDLARFAETDGFEHDKERPEAWRYRDWVINAFNSDLPYDQFVELQIAGDELRPGDESAKIATGFCVAGPDMPDINSQDERRDSLLNEIAGTVGAALLGLQTGCAQCHDHKFDPISQADFYRLRAIFEPAVNLKRDRSLSVLPEGAPASAASRLMIRGDFRRPGPVVEPAYLRIGNPWGLSLVANQDAGGVGLRAALAKWLARPDHPQATRVIANRLWQWHFGQGLSRTPSDFGVLGDQPRHDRLLDWLATELVRRDWSLKEMHRLIVTSAVYRQASRSAGDSWRRSQEVDPENRLWSRYPRRRLTGEMLRDSMLAAASALSTKQHGPGVRPPLPEELTETLLKNQWVVTPDAGEHDRRSIYLFARRNLRYPIFEVFDRPDANASCPERNRSVAASQSLLLINSDFSLTAARRLAGAAFSSAADPTDQAAHAVLLAFGRPATDAEIDRAREFLDRQRELLAAEGEQRQDLALPLVDRPIEDPYAAAALTDFCLALFCANEFLYVD